MKVKMLSNCFCRLCVIVAVILSFVATGSEVSASAVLVWSTGNEQARTEGLAAQLFATGGFTSVTGIDQIATMTLVELTAYDKVLYFSNTSAGQDAAAIGDVLADFADTGRRLVISTFSWADQGGNTLGGRIIADSLSPFLLEGSSLYSNVTMASNDGSAFFTGVNTLDGFFHDNIALTSGAVLHGTWSDGEALLASKGNVVGVNLFADASWGAVSGDNINLFKNALGPDTAAVPEPASIAMWSLGGLGMMIARRKRQKKNLSA